MSFRDQIKGAVSAVGQEASRQIRDLWPDGHEDRAPFNNPNAERLRAPADASTGAAPSWMPAIDLPSASRLVWDLAGTPGVGISDDYVLALVRQWNEVSGKPHDSLEVMRQLYWDKDKPKPKGSRRRKTAGAPDEAAKSEFYNRPWLWLAEVLRTAADQGDHRTAVAGASWAFYWQFTLSERWPPQHFMAVSMNSRIPREIRVTIADIAESSASALPLSEVLFEDSTGCLSVADVAGMAQLLR